MNVTPIQRWLNYAADFYSGPENDCVIEEEKERFTYRLDGRKCSYFWNEEFYHGLVQAVKTLEENNISPPEEIEDWFAHTVKYEKLHEFEYNFEILTKDYSYVISITEQIPFDENRAELNIYIKSRKRKTYVNYYNDDYNKLILPYIRALSREMEKFYLNRKNVRLKHLICPIEIERDVVFENLCMRTNENWRRNR